MCVCVWVGGWVGVRVCGCEGVCICVCVGRWVGGCTCVWWVKVFAYVSTLPSGS